MDEWRNEWQKYVDDYVPSWIPECVQSSWNGLGDSIVAISRYWAGDWVAVDEGLDFGNIGLSHVASALPGRTERVHVAGKQKQEDADSLEISLFHLIELKQTFPIRNGLREQWKVGLNPFFSEGTFLSGSFLESFVFDELCDGSRMISKGQKCTSKKCFQSEYVLLCFGSPS